jgi:U1 small nuclear ribonucleoprotein 70kDa
MTDKLPQNLLALFQPRPPLRYIPPQDTPPEDRALKQSQISGVAAFLPALAEYAATDYYEPTESWLQRKDRIKAEKKARLEEMARDDFKEFQPENDPQIRGDAVKTLFVGRLAYEAKEGDLEREFGRFGPIERVCQNVLKEPAIIIAAMYALQEKLRQPQARSLYGLVYRRHIIRSLC